MSTQHGTRPGARGRLARFVPAAAWVPAYQRRWLRADLIAGCTIWGLLVPEGIAYASLAGLPPQAGLYTLLASLVLYAVFGTSRHLVVAGTSASAILVYSTITQLHPSGAAAYASLAGGLIILAGLLFLVSGFFKLGFITQFLSRPVIDGFVFGLALFVAVSQLPKLFGLEKGPGDTVRQFADLAGHLGRASWLTFAVGAVALALLFALDRVKRVPGGLVVLALAIVVSTACHLDRHGVATVGKVPAGLPGVHRPELPLHDLWVLLPSAAGLMLVIFSEALAAADTFADKHGYSVDPSQDMIALGLANLGSGLLGGLAAGGSLSQSTVNDGAGAESELSPVIAAVLSLVTVLALTSLFTSLPEAVLAAMLIHAVSHLMRVGRMRRFYRLVRREFWLGVLTLVGVITLDVLAGLVIGVMLSLLVLVYRASRPVVALMGADPDLPGAFLDVSRHPNVTPVPGVLILRPRVPLFYANAKPVREALRALVLPPAEPVRAVILDLAASEELDVTSAEALAATAAELHREHVRLGLAHLHTPAADLLRRSGVLGEGAPDSAVIPEQAVFPTLESAVEWAQASPRPVAPLPGPRRG
jgi:sulfate permease, SulP family